MWQNLQFAFPACLAGHKIGLQRLARQQLRIEGRFMALCGDDLLLSFLTLFARVYVTTSRALRGAATTGRVEWHIWSKHHSIGASDSLLR